MQSGIPIITCVSHLGMAIAYLPILHNLNIMWTYINTGFISTLEWRYTSHVKASEITITSNGSGLQQRNRQRSALLALCQGNLPINDGFPSQRASSAESLSMSWRQLEMHRTHILKRIDLRSPNACLLEAKQGRWSAVACQAREASRLKNTRNPPTPPHPSFKMDMNNFGEITLYHARFLLFVQHACPNPIGIYIMYSKIYEKAKGY